MRAAIYARVSTKNQVDGYSLDDQLRICQEYAEKQGWDVTGVYTDEGHSAYRNTEQRPQLQKLEEAARAGEFEAVIVYKLDRFARKTEFQLKTAAELERIGVVLHSATEPNNRTSAAGRFSFTVMAAAAEFESHKTSERMAIARHEAVL